MTVPHRLWLIERLKQLGLGRADLARKMNVSKRQVERWCAGGGAHVSTQYDLALALELPPSQVYALFACANKDKGRSLSIQGEQSASGEYRPVSDEEFYSYYATKIATARNDVWVTSDGFNLRSRTSRGYAEIMAPGFRAALANGALVYRYQVTETMHINWIDELIRLKTDFPRQFRVFVNPAVADVASVCAIDPGSGHCVAEAFEGTRGGFCQATVAADYSFVLHDRGKARERQDVVESAIDAADSEELSTEGLRKLRDALFAERAEQLRRWCADNDDPNADLTESGVFDEVVVGHFVRQAIAPPKHIRAV